MIRNDDSRQMSDLLKSFLLATLFAVMCGLTALLNAVPWTGQSWQSLFRWIASPCCFGFLLGGIYAFDPESEFKIRSSFIGRVSFGMKAALMLSALWHWPAEGIVLAGLVGAVLGYFGMSWAKHVDF